MQSGCGAPVDMLSSDTVSWLRKDIEGWKPVGCASEANNENLLRDVKASGGGMTVQKCLDYCAERGFGFAGLKNRNSCSCGAAFDAARINAGYSCNLQCEGNADGT